MTVYFKQNEKKLHSLFSASLYAFLIKRIKKECFKSTYSGGRDDWNLANGLVKYLYADSSAENFKSTLTATFHCNPIMWLLKCISLPISLCAALLRPTFFLLQVHVCDIVLLCLCKFRSLWCTSCTVCCDFHVQLLKHAFDFATFESWRK